MKKVNPHKPKYFNLYMDIAIQASKSSVAVRRKVGAVIVLPSGLISLGFNGTPSGFDNNCEYEHLKEKITKPEVIHAERNAIDKMTREGLSTENSILFITAAPCLNCAISIANVGISKVFYLQGRADNEGIEHLQKRNIPVYDFVKDKYFYSGVLEHG